MYFLHKTQSPHSAQNEQTGKNNFYVICYNIELIDYHCSIKHNCIKSMSINLYNQYI